jgi:hypothetical protein
MNRFRDNLTVGYWIATQFVRNNLPQFTTMTSQYPFEKAFCRCSISKGLQEYIYHLAVLINCPPEVMLLTVDLHKYFIDVEGVTVTSVLELQSQSVQSAELNTPEPDRFTTDGNATLGKNIFNITVTKIESVVEPNGVTDDVGWESVSFI